MSEAALNTALMAPKQESESGKPEKKKRHERGYSDISV